MCNRKKTEKNIKKSIRSKERHDRSVSAASMKIGKQIMPSGIRRTDEHAKPVRNWSYNHIALKQRFVVKHTFSTTEIPALLESWILLRFFTTRGRSNTPRMHHSLQAYCAKWAGLKIRILSKVCVHKKNYSTLRFLKNINAYILVYQGSVKFFSVYSETL